MLKTYEGYYASSFQHINNLKILIFQNKIYFLTKNINIWIKNGYCNPTTVQNYLKAEHKILRLFINKSVKDFSL